MSVLSLLPGERAPRPELALALEEVARARDEVRVQVQLVDEAVQLAEQAERTACAVLSLEHRQRPYTAGQLLELYDRYRSYAGVGFAGRWRDAGLPNVQRLRADVARESGP